jgi:DNA-binding NtrC family response regulator
MQANSHATKAGPHEIVGDSAWAVEIRAKVLSLAACPSNVLITGPTGTGKEVIAQAIHAHSPRADKPFIPVDCAAITGTLFASHVFGHLRGAFTGAEYAAQGAFRAAHGGTVFLDEIAELECDTQTKLLRVLQQRAVTPLGSHEATPVDIRVIAATNRDLPREIAQGRFRADLYYRLHVVSLRTTPLRDRPEDIEPLARHFFSKLAVLHGLRPKRLSAVALHQLHRHDWPGNVRQLENVLERAFFLTAGDLIGVDEVFISEGALAPEPAAALLPFDAPDTPSHGIVRPRAANGPQPPARLLVAGDGDWLTLAEAERQHILRTLERTSYNQSEAARLLRIERHRLARKIRKYGLDRPGVEPARRRAKAA